MNQEDKIIKEILQSKMQKMDDEFFTKRIVDSHLKSKQSTKKKSAFDFISLIIGLISVMISVGLGFLVISNVKLGLTIQHILILFSISVIYVMYSLLGEIITPKRVEG